VAARGVFVTGTGTEVGKTVVAAAIAHTLAAKGQRVSVFKPCVTGLEEFAADGPISGDRGGNSSDRPDHEILRAAAGSEQSDDEIAPYRYGPPASPHLAAALAGEEIDPGCLREAAAVAAEGADAIVCEGVGGLLVPLTSGYLVRDLAADLGYPLVVVGSPGLGTINHTLLTLGSAWAAGLEVASVVLTPWPGQPTEVERSNRETIALVGEVEVQTLPRLDLSVPGGWPALSPRR